VPAASGRRWISTVEDPGGTEWSSPSPPHVKRILRALRKPLAALVLEVWTSDCEIRLLVAEPVGRLGSGVEVSVAVPSGVRGNFRACEVHEQEYSPGAIFR